MDNLDITELAMAWPRAVGKKVSAHTSVRELVRSRLVVDVEDRIWQRQMVLLTEHILRNLGRVLGPGKVPTELDFVVRPKTTSSETEEPLPFPELSLDPDLAITFTPDCSAPQVQATLAALADYYRACGGVGFEIEFELEDVFVSERTYA
jgi:Dna[CI] antecedent, DciA